MFTKDEIEKRVWNIATVEIKLDDYNSWDELSDYVNENNLCEEEVIYYSTAIQYLMENDPSLSESIEIASEIGYSLVDVNSELLATLLKSRDNQEAFYGMESEIQEYYESLEQ